MSVLMNVLYLVSSVLVIYLFYDLIIVPFKKKNEGKLVRVFIYEYVGRDLVYKNQTIAEEKKDSMIGSYLYIKKGKIALQRISNEEFIYDKKYGKSLIVVKYSEDDYRPLVRLKGETWYKKIKKPVLEITSEIDEEGNKVTIEKEKVGSDGNVITNDVYVEYKEPLGINQEMREVMRFNLQYQKKLDEMYAKQLSGWEKILPYASVGLVAIILMISFITMTNKHAETQERMTLAFVEGATAYKQAQESPEFAKNLLDKIQKKEVEDNAPPS